MAKPLPLNLMPFWPAGREQGQAGRGQAGVWWGSRRRLAVGWQAGTARPGRQSICKPACHAHRSTAARASRAHPSASWTGRWRTGTAGQLPQRAPHPWTAAGYRRAQTRCPRTQSSCARTAAGRGRGGAAGGAGDGCSREGEGWMRRVMVVCGWLQRSGGRSASSARHPPTLQPSLPPPSLLFPHPPGRA